jgi:hypothetical protein
MRAYLIAAALIVSALAFGITSAQAQPSAVAPSIALASPPGVAATQPALGQTVAFVTTYSASAYKNPVVVLNCYQNGVVVWGYVGTPTDTYKLGGDGSPWLSNGGSASCVADLENLTIVHRVENFQKLAETSFTANA